MELSIHQCLNVEQPYMAEIENLSNSETVSIEFTPKPGVTVDEIMASCQNLFPGHHRSSPRRKGGGAA